MRSHRSFHSLWQPWKLSEGGLGGLAAPHFPHVALAARCCRGQVPDSRGGMRWDETHAVVLDGMVTDAERQEILDFVTEPGWDHTQGPPETKWERTCTDRAGVTTARGSVTGGAPRNHA